MLLLGQLRHPCFRLRQAHIAIACEARALFKKTQRFLQREGASFQKGYDFL